MGEPEDPEARTLALAQRIVDGGRRIPFTVPTADQRMLGGVSPNIDFRRFVVRHDGARWVAVEMSHDILAWWGELDGHIRRSEAEARAAWRTLPIHVRAWRTLKYWPSRLRYRVKRLAGAPRRALEAWAEWILERR